MHVANDAIANSNLILARIVQASLRETVEPALPEGRAKLMVQAAYDLIGDLLQAQAPVDDPDWSAALADLPPALAAEAGEGSPAEQVEAMMGTLIARLCRPADPEQDATLQWLRSVAALQEAAIVERPSLASGYTMSATFSLPGYQPPTLIGARLEAYFAGRPDLTGDASEVKVRLLGGGSSKSSFLVECAGPGGARALIVRREGTHLPLDSSVVDEFPLLKFLEPFGLPQPHALHLETDLAVCGTPFIVFEKSEGVPGPEGWGTPEQVRSIAIELAQFLARLHAVPVADLVVETPNWLNPMHLCRSVEGLEAFWQRIRFRPEPLMEAIIAWLKLNKPADTVAPVLVHGDAAFHNVLAADGRLSAVLDWEVAHLGQPAEDLGYVQPFVSSVMDWSEFYQAYRDAGGGEVALETQRFYAVLAFARITLSIYHGLYALHRAHPGLDTKDAWIASRYAHRFMVESFRRIVD